MRICIDPGHGGHDPGAISKDLREADVNLAVAKLLLSELGHTGHDVTITRKQDITVPLYQRAVIANQANCSLFISLHCNAATNTEAEGVEVCICPTKQSKQLADDVLGAIKPMFVKNRGVKERPELVVLKHTEMPAVLVEMGFITHARENKMLASSEFHQSLALAIAKGIKVYLNR